MSATAEKPAAATSEKRARKPRAPSEFTILVQVSPEDATVFRILGNSTAGSARKAIEAASVNGGLEDTPLGSRVVAVAAKQFQPKQLTMSIA